MQSLFYGTAGVTEQNLGPGYYISISMRSYIKIYLLIVHTSAGLPPPKHGLLVILGNDTVVNDSNCLSFIARFFRFQWNFDTMVQ